MNLHLLQVVVQDFYLLTEYPLMSLEKSLDSHRTGFRFNVLLHADYYKSPRVDHSIIQSLSLLVPKVNRYKTIFLHICWDDSVM